MHADDLLTYRHSACVRSGAAANQTHLRWRRPAIISNIRFFEMNTLKRKSFEMQG
jgi:hypothetical protein